MKLTQATVLVVFVVIFATAESKMTMDQIKNTMKPFKKSCLKKTTVDEALVEGTKSGQFPEDRSLMCFLRCVLQMLKVIKNGVLDLNSLMTQIDIMMPEEHVDRMKEICTACQEKASQKEDACDISYEFVKCFYEMDPSLYFFP